MDRQYYTYILASRKNGTLYVGITSDLVKRVWEHKNRVMKGFTSRYKVDRLVYYEVFDDPGNAINREKRLKYYKRQWKIDLIEKDNPEWKDLYGEILPGFCGSWIRPGSDFSRSDKCGAPVPGAGLKQACFRIRKGVSCDSLSKPGKFLT